MRLRLLILLLTTLSVVAVAVWLHVPEEEAEWPLPAGTLRVPFRLNGHLRIKPTHGGGLIHGSSVLVLETGTQTREVWSLSALRGAGTIENAKGALAFVRLRTSPRTGGFVKSDRNVEVLPSEDFDLNLFYEIDDRLLPNPSAGTWGVVSSQWMLKHHFEPVSVKRTENGWTIERWWVDTSEFLHPIFTKVREEVGPDCSYKLTVLATRKGSPDPDVVFFIPPSK